ncbi:hypothetical protein CRG98_013719 [Punica granatum]|uniref:Retrovirus-related Pol polyprotein from transposon TNT 1-94-like beta-barrel domain-containing protein n=1 Tax=Punica granatum TaxID=22663 RepID=A0A2I0KBJ0_PUNGR|nr:hypothetical protein CRG98_013719 [Punica granatum]
MPTLNRVYGMAVQEDNQKNATRDREGSIDAAALAASSAGRLPGRLGVAEESRRGFRASRGCGLRAKDEPVGIKEAYLSAGAKPTYQQKHQASGSRHGGQRSTALSMHDSGSGEAAALTTEQVQQLLSLLKASESNQNVKNFAGMISIPNGSGSGSIMDTGATVHLTGNSDWLIDYVSIDRPYPIWVAEGRRVYAEQIGCAKIRSNLLLQNVLYVSNFFVQSDFGWKDDEGFKLCNSFLTRSLLDTRLANEEADWRG